MLRPARLLLLIYVTLTISSWAMADDWPQWMGPQRDGVWREDGLIERFPAEGLPVKWQAEVGYGYAGPAVAGGRVYVMDYEKTSGKIGNNPGKRDELEGKERVLAFDAATGELLWKHAYDQSYRVSYAGGPRCTPTVADGKIYTLGAEGRLVCLDTSGDVVWQKDLKKTYGAPTPQWGFAAHPLVDGQTLYCLVGGPGSVAVAFDKDTGEELWKTLDAKDQGYCPPTMIEHAGRKQLLIWHPQSLNSLEPATGEVLWSVPLKPDFGMSIAAPRLLGSQLFASGVRSSAVLLELTDEPGAEIVWRGEPKTAIYSANATPILEDGVIYGCNNSGTLTCAKLSDGERLWETTDPTTGDRPKGYATVFLVKQADRFLLFNDSGDLILAKLSPEGYEELDRQNLLAPTNFSMGRDVVRSHPAFAQRCVFARNDEKLVCVSLAAE